MKLGPGLFRITWLLLGRRAGRPESETVAASDTQGGQKYETVAAGDAQGGQKPETVTRTDPQGRPRAPACETVASARPAMASRLSGLGKSLL